MSACAPQDWIHFTDFPPFAQGRQLLQIPVCLLRHLATEGTNSFLFRVHVISEGEKKQF